MPAFELPVTLETLDSKTNFSTFYRQTYLGLSSMTDPV